MWDTAIAHFGSQLAIERAIGIRQSSISYRVTRGLPIPPEWAIAMETASNGKLSRHVLRPDLWPAPVIERRTADRRTPDAAA